MNVILRKISHIPSRLRSTYREIKDVFGGLNIAISDAYLIRQRLRNTPITGERLNKVAVINAGRFYRIADVELYLAHILAANGLTVYVLFDDGVLEHWDGAQVHNINYYSPYRARWYIRWKYMLTKHLIFLAYRRPGMKLVNYSTILKHFQPCTDLELADIHDARSSTERFFETSVLDVEGDHREYYEMSLKNCAMARRVAQYALDVFKPDIYITVHGIYSIWGPAYRVIKNANIPVVAWQVAGTTTNKIRFADRHDGVLASTCDWKEFQAQPEATQPVTQEEGQSLIETRLAHRTQDTQEYFGLKLPAAGDVAVTEGNGQISFGMFPNVVWDGNIAQRNIMFENVIEWCEFTINAFRDTPHHLFVRFHPSETTRLKGTIPLEDIIRDRIPDVDSLENVTLISSSQSLDSYQFAREHVDVGLIYDGTLCVELTYMGIPVVACTNGNFTPDEIVFKPQSREEYASYLAQPAPILAAFAEERTERIAQACTYAYWLFKHSLHEFSPLERPYPAKIDYRRVESHCPLSPDQQSISDRLMKPLKTT